MPRQTTQACSPLGSTLRLLAPLLLCGVGLWGCGSDDPSFPDLLTDATVGDGTTLVDDGGSDTPGNDVDPSDTPVEDVDGGIPCDPSCESLARGACVDGVCGECDEGLSSDGGADTACCAPGQLLSADGLRCELPPECDGVVCNNGGACVVVQGAGVCDCPVGTTGDSCETTCDSGPLPVTSCDADGQDCLGWFDPEAPTPFNGGGCDELPCFFDDGECANGCVNFTITLGLDATFGVQRVDWRSDWWSKRPESVTVLIGPTDRVGDAVEVGEFTGQQNPWQCVTGEACDESVPDECCPDGRDQPQRIEEGALLSKWDFAELESAVGTHVFFRVNRAYQRDSIIMQDMRAFGTECLGGLACDPEVEDCREPCPAGTERDGDECVDIDGCRDNPCFDGVACSDVAAPSTGFECGPCPEGLEGDGITCTSVDCTPECADWESCVSGSCQPRRCSEGCGSGTCFEGVCGNAGTCESQCASRYGSGDTWECVDQGYCRKVNCRRGTECGSGVDCVSDPDNNSRGPGGGGVFDQTCVGGGSPCGGTCDGLCSATSGRCLG